MSNADRNSERGKRKMEDEKMCGNCYYERFEPLAYPCAMCIRGFERNDKWAPKRQKRKPESLLEAYLKFMLDIDDDEVGDDV